MALNTRRFEVGANQDKSGLTVVKYRATPLRRTVTLCAILREPCITVVRVCRRGEIFFVTSDTLLRSSGVSSVNVTLETSYREMRTSERELAEVVIKSRFTPNRRIVALSAGLREVAADVIRIFNAVKIGQMAVHAIVRRTRKSLRVTLGALDADMRTGQLERCECVIKRGVFPLCRRVAFGTILLEGR